MRRLLQKRKLNMPSMNFWRAEVEAGKVITVTDAECTITVTHITLDKGRDEGSVVLYARVNGMRTQVIGTLSQKVPQMKCKLIFPHEFSLSHSHQSACVHFLGSYKDHNSDSGNDETDTDDSPDNLANYEQKEEVKKGGHTSTPHRAKKGGNSPMNANQSPKSGGQSSGGNKKQFNSGGKQFGSNSKGKKRKGKGRA